MSDNFTLYYNYELVELSRLFQDISIKGNDYGTTAIFHIPNTEIINDFEAIIYGFHRVLP